MKKLKTSLASSLLFQLIGTHKDDSIMSFNKDAYSFLISEKDNTALIVNHKKNKVAFSEGAIDNMHLIPFLQLPEMAFKKDGAIVKRIVEKERSNMQPLTIIDKSLIVYFSKESGFLSIYKFHRNKFYQLDLTDLFNEQSFNQGN